MFKRFLILAVFACLMSPLAAQTITKSPYSGFGLGEIFRQASSRNAAMGGVGIGLSNKYSYSNGNPASTSDLLMMTVDVAAYGQYTLLKTQTQKSYVANGGLNSIAMVFKKKKSFAINLGITPLTVMGYTSNRTTDIVTATDTAQYGTYRDGSGGLNEAYLGASFRLLKKRLAMGINAKFDFGTLKNVSETYMLFKNVTNPQPRVVFSQRRLALGGGATVGFQYQDTLKKISNNTFWRIGVKVDLPTFMNVKDITVMTTLQYISNEPSDGLYYAVVDTIRKEKSSTVMLPPLVGAGFSIEKFNHYTIAADVTWQDWSKFRVNADDPTFGQSITAQVGGEYIPNANNIKNYFARIAIRAGFYYQMGFLNLEGKNISQMAGTFGLGLPLSFRSGTRLNIALEINNRGYALPKLLKETGFKLYLGVNFSELWFSPRKYD